MREAGPVAALAALSLLGCRATEAEVVPTSFGVDPLPADMLARLGRVSVRRLRAEGFTKACAVTAPSGAPIWIVAQPGVPDLAVARARNLLRFYLSPVPGAKYGSAELKAAVANTMAARGAMLMMPEGAHREGHEPDLPAQPLYEEETPVEGSAWYLECDWEHRDAAFEEIFHLVHDEGIGTDRPGALPALQAALDAEARRAIEDGRWGIPIEPEVGEWLAELEEEYSLAQEYIASVIDTYYGLWGPFDERAGGMWGIYCAKTREELDDLDPGGRALLESFLPPTLAGYEALIDPGFEGTFTLRFDPRIPWTHKSRYLVEARLTGAMSSGLEGNELDNVLTGNGGDNAIDGGEGHDVACFRGPRADYRVGREGMRVVVRDGHPDRDGTDTLSGIEVLRFADAEVRVDDLQD